MDVSIIIVNYNTKEIIKNCLKSIYAQTKDISFEVIVSDNGSVDGSSEMLKSEFPQVILIENNANLGFGKANNVAAKNAKGKYFFFLNSDTVLLNNAVKIFFDFAESQFSHREHCIYGCMLTDLRGNIVHSYEKFTPPAKGVFRCIVQTYPHLAGVSSRICLKNDSSTDKQIKTSEIQFIIGADLFVLAEDFYALDGFDEHFFMFFEDEDLCRRALLLEIACCIMQDAKIVHLESRSTKVKSKKIQFFESSFLFYAKRYYSFATNLLIRVFFVLYSFFRLFDFRFSLKEKIEMFSNTVKSVEEK